MVLNLLTDLPASFMRMWFINENVTDRQANKSDSFVKILVHYFKEST